MMHEPKTRMFQEGGTSRRCRLPFRIEMGCELEDALAYCMTTVCG
jgi:hypothetical protein